MDNEEKSYTLTLTSTPMLYVPGLMAHAQHIYTRSEKGRLKAISILDTLFDSQVTEEALISILTKERPPLFSVKDLNSLSETYPIHFHELTEVAKERINNS